MNPISAINSELNELIQILKEKSGMTEDEIKEKFPNVFQLSQIDDNVIKMLKPFMVMLPKEFRPK